MKRALQILIIIIPFVTFANFHPGVMTLNDGTIKKGLIEIPDDSENSKIKFKSDEDAKKEKIALELIKSFVVYNDKNQSQKFIITHLAYFNPFSKENNFRKHNKLACVAVAREGKLTLCYAWFMTAGAGGGAVGGATVTGGSTSGETFIYKEGNDYALEFYQGSLKGFNISVNSFKHLKDMITKHFGNECPKLVDLINKEDIKKNGITRVFELYEQNCQ